MRRTPVDSHELTSWKRKNCLPELAASPSKTELSHRWPFLTAWFVAQFSEDVADVADVIRHRVLPTSSAFPASSAWSPSTSMSTSWAQLPKQSLPVKRKKVTEESLQRRIKHVMCSKPLESTVLACVICLSSLSSTSILCTRLPGRIPLVPRMRLVQLQHFYASNFQRKFFKRFRAQIPLSSLFERRGLTRGPRRPLRLAQDLHKEDHNEGKMKNNFDFVSKSGAQANGPYRTVTLYMLESHGPRKKPIGKTCNFSALCTNMRWEHRGLCHSRKMIALTMVTFGKITHVPCLTLEEMYQILCQLNAPSSLHRVCVCVCLRGCRHLVDPCSWAIDDRSHRLHRFFLESLKSSCTAQPWAEAGSPTSESLKVHSEVAKNLLALTPYVLL